MQLDDALHERQAQVQPRISSSVAPVYSNQRLLYQKMKPSLSAIQASWGTLSASVRKVSSLDLSAASDFFASPTSRM